MPNVDLGIGFEQPQWMAETQAKWQAQIDQVNRQLAQINPAAPAAAAGVGVLAIAGLLTGLYYASCQLGWNEPTEGGSSSGSSSRAEGENTEGENVEGGTAGSSFEGSSKKNEDEADAEEAPADEVAAN